MCEVFKDLNLDLMIKLAQLQFSVNLALFILINISSTFFFTSVTFPKNLFSVNAQNVSRECEHKRDKEI